jgi:hypothetical protein
LTGLVTCFSTCELGLTTLNVNDGVHYLYFGNLVLGELEAFPNLDINVLFKTLILEIKHIFIFVLLKNM